MSIESGEFKDLSVPEENPMDLPEAIEVPQERENQRDTSGVLEWRMDNTDMAVRKETGIEKMNMNHSRELLLNFNKKYQEDLYNVPIEDVDIYKDAAKFFIKFAELKGGISAISRTDEEQLKRADKIIQQAEEAEEIQRKASAAA